MSSGKGGSEAMAGAALTGRDEAILDHVATYRITVPEVLHKLFFPGAGASAVRKVLFRLTKGGYMEARDLHRKLNLKYWTLSSAVAHERGLSEDFRRIGPQALADAYAMLHFCVFPEGDVVRTHVPRIKLLDQRPQFVIKGLPSQYYFLETVGERVRLGFLVVDHGANYLRVLRKCRSVTQKRYAKDPFRDIIREERFLIGVATCHEKKRERMQEALDRGEVRTSVPYSIEVVEGLRHLIPK